MNYGQFCPIAKASEILGEKWTILIVRELLMGSTRFSELQRGLGDISPTVLTKRLAMLDERGLVVRRHIPGQRGFEYHPTDSCKQLMPILLALGDWGMRWARTNVADTEYDASLLMLYLERSIASENLPGRETVVKFRFADLDKMSEWWLIVTADGTDVCTTDPGRDVDVYFDTTVRTMTEIWLGSLTYRTAIADDALRVTGPRGLTRNISAWLRSSAFADLPSAKEIRSGTHLI